MEPQNNTLRGENEKKQKELVILAMTGSRIISMDIGHIYSLGISGSETDCVRLQQRPLLQIAKSFPRP
jgi:hypothetical protein